MFLDTAQLRRGGLSICLPILLTACFGSDEPEVGSSAHALEADCTDGVDDDGDGLFDCADPECAADPFCVTCGDGALDAGETCDDGNTTAGDGCSSACQEEDGFACRVPGQSCKALVCSADEVGADTFMRLNFVETGINANGGFGTTANAPAGYHARGNDAGGLFMGFVSDPNDTNWTSYDGDFFTPGGPVEGWAIEVGGVASYNGDRGGATAIAGTTGTPSCVTSGLCGGDGGSQVSWASNAAVGGVQINKNYILADGAAFILAEVTLTNTTAAAINNVYYMRNLDPDNNQSTEGDYSTRNTIISQPAGGITLAQVQAAQLTGDGFTRESTLSLLADDARARVTRGGFANRIPSQVWNATGGLANTGEDFSDTAISLAFKFDTIAAGESVVFKYAYNLEATPDAAISCAGDNDGDGDPDPSDPDDDNDGVCDDGAAVPGVCVAGPDPAPFNATICRDTDADSCDDCSITADDGSGGDPANDGTDTDGDGICDAGDPDSDNDGVCDGPTAVGGVCIAGPDAAPTDPNVCLDSDADTCDDCSSGSYDPADDGADNDSDGLCDAGDDDNDNDGVCDGASAGAGCVAGPDTAPTDPNVCLDSDADTCDDCSSGSYDPADDGTDTDSDGACDAGDDDDDNDGVCDGGSAGAGCIAGPDTAPTDPNVCLDSDSDTCDDCSSGSYDPANDGPDGDGDGTCDAGEVDSDSDGVCNDAVAVPGVCIAGPDTAPNDPTVCLDSDADGCDDCTGGSYNPAADGLDSDSDGICNVGDIDDDNDGVCDGGSAGPGCIAGPDTAPTNANVCLDSDSDTCDDCSSGSYDPSSDGTDNDSDGLCDAGDEDDDNDGVCDGASAGAGCIAGPDTAPTNANVCLDSDSDTCDDCSSGSYDPSSDGTDNDSDGLCDAGDDDDDNDGVCDGASAGAGCVAGPDTAPTNANVCLDSDSDTCDDCSSGSYDPAADGVDNDSDGLCDAGDDDDDNDGVCDGMSAGAGCVAGPDTAPTDTNVCLDSDADTCDDCSSGTYDPADDGDDNDSDGLCDAGDDDDDNDGVCDDASAGAGCIAGPDADPNDANVCLDSDADTCDDCSSGTYDPADDGDDNDSDGLCDAGDDDDDNDGVCDDASAGAGCIAGPDTDPTDANVCLDSDADTCDDCSSGTYDPADDGADHESDGLCDAGDPDDDNDGICDGPADDTDCVAGPDTDPTDNAVCADADNDTCDDCSVVMSSGGDTDDDGFDGDADGTCDEGEDTDGDGTLDVDDIDDDNDGIPDTLEMAGVDPNDDADSDGIPNYLDADDDGSANGADCADDDLDDVCDAPSSHFDADGDGVPNHLDLDSDNDGIADVIEAGHGVDAGADGVLDGDDVDGLDDSVDAAGDGDIDYPIRDTDGDGTPDYLDTDSDNDGETDISESGNGGLDGDDDGMIDDIVDGDGDGIDNDVDADDGEFGFPGTATSDLVDNYDGDGDGIPDAYDASDDGNPEDDSDGDGIGDNIECPNPAGWPTCPDADADGTPDYSTDADTDGDGVLDRQDLDADDDGIPDDRENLEGINPDADADGDGIPNYLDADDRGDGTAAACEDLDADRFCDEIDPLFDADGDGVANHLDLDSDNDGIADIVEAGHGSADADGDGTVDCAAGVGDNGLCDELESSPESGDINYGLLNTDGAADDGDEIPDFLDLDSDADGDYDIDEVSALAGLDNDGDGRIDDDTDDDNDGLASAVDADDDTFGFPGAASDPGADDADGDGIPDAYDVEEDGANSGDSDGDGIPDDVECGSDWPCSDLDGDGIPDYMEPNDSDGDDVNDESDLDDDNDGILDTDENELGVDPSADNDGDGIPNFIDADDRGDGVAANCMDTDANGACDVLDPLFDFDGDGMANHVDTDADNDNINDADESGAGGADADGDGVLDCAAGVGDNGLCDDVETSPESGDTAEPVDTDDDGDFDFLDTDSDDDGIEDADEAGDEDPATDPVDTDGDGTPDYQDLDSDDDSISDEIEAGDDDPSTDPVDTDGDGDPDYTDTDSDNDGVDDEEEVGDDPSNPVDTDGDGEADYVDTDSDNDNVDDGEDNCRFDANNDQIDGDSDGAGQACDTDDNDDGFDDNLGASGGGCSAAGTSTEGGLVLLLGLALLALGFGRRRRRAVLVGAASAVALVGLGQGVARAQSNTVDSEYAVERMRISSDRGGILDVESANVPGHLSFDLGFWVGYADDPLTLQDRDDDMRVAELVSQRLGGDLVGSLALFDRVALAVAVPLVLKQEQAVGSFMGPPESLSSFGIGDIRLSPKLQVLKSEDIGLDVAIAASLTLPTASSEDYFGDKGVTFSPELLASKSFTEQFRAGLNLGYRARGSKQTLDIDVDDEIFAHLGGAFMATEALEANGTFSVATGANDIFGSANRNYSEARAGLAYYLKEAVIFGAVGAGTSGGYGAPDWRVLAGLRFGMPGASDEEPSLGQTLVVDDNSEPPAAENLDSDGDGVLDDVDGCPSGAETMNGFEDGDGCPDDAPDSDGDGLADNLDRCPQDSEDLDSFEDDDGCPDPDNDGDGVLDGADACASESGPMANKGCPDPDRDGDGVVDRLDNCPDEAGTDENSGCAKEQLVKFTGSTLEILDRVYFKTNRARILRKSNPLLENVAQVLNNHPEVKSIEVQGHTDSQGSDGRNKLLSQQRAQRVVDFLIAAGVDGSRLHPVGYGEDVPVNDNGTREGRASNRRVEFKLAPSSK